MRIGYRWTGLVAFLLLLFPGSQVGASLQDVQTVFIILMENHNWSSIRGSSSAPYINNVLLPMASRAEQYYNPPSLHPSEPNYIWLEAGDNLGISNDNNPSSNHQSTANHFVTQLKNAGISWRSYQEDICGCLCPLVSTNKYFPKHNPMVFFDDVTDTNNANSAYCIANVRPYTQLVGDLASNTVARYNFLTPNQCNDMHDSCAPTNNSIRQGDTWLSNNIPVILNSQAYSNGGAIFITWDEGAGSSDGPIGMIVISRLAKGGGYTNVIHYTHSSTLRTMQEIFNVRPFLRDATNATDLSDLFNPFPGLTNVTPACGGLTGGTPITITGTNFVSGATVTVGGVPATGVVYVNSTTLSAMTPANSAGAKTVVVTNPDTQTATLSNAFTYVSPPVFAGLGAVTAAVESATLTWSAATGTGITYSVYQGTASGAENFGSPIATTAGLSAFVSPLDPGSTNAITYYFVVRAGDACGNGESNNTEVSIQPLLNPNNDQDGDGIPNGFEQAYGLNPFDATDANMDADGDGFSNLQEYQAGTDPADANSSPFRITDVHLESGGVRVTWAPGAGTTNTLQSTAGGADGNYETNAFADIFTVTNAATPTTNYLDVGAATNFPGRFYRVRLVP